MAISFNTQGQIAFKNLLGKSQTTDVFQISEESFGIGVEVQAKDVTIDKISATSSSLTVQNGLAIKVKAVLVADAGSSGKAYRANWPATLTGNILEQPPGKDPKTNTDFAYDQGSLKGIKGGDRITNLISNGISSEYEAVLKASDGTVIPPRDFGDWVFQYNSGILYVDSPGKISNTPAFIEAYYYIGTRLSDFSTKTQTNIRVSATGSDSYFATFSSPMVDSYQSNYIFLVDFFGYNTGATVSLNINSIGTSSVYKPTPSGPMPLVSGDIIGATGGTAGRIYYLVYNQPGKYFEFFYSNPVSTSGNFSNLVPTNYTVGGIDKGQSFNDVKVVDMLMDMLYPEKMGRVGTFSMLFNSLLVPTKFEVGETMSSGNYTFNWTFDNQSDLKDRSVRIEDVTTVTQVQNNWVFPSATPFTQSSGLTGPVTFNFSNAINSFVPNKRTFRLSVERTNGTIVNKDYEVNWMWNVYYGSSTFSTLTSSQVRNLSVATLSNQSLGTWTFSGDGFKYIAFPNDTSYNYSNITFKGIPFTLAGTSSGYSFSSGDLNYLLATISNIRGVDKQYKVYRSKNEINATFSVNIS